LAMKTLIIGQLTPRIIPNAIEKAWGSPNPKAGLTC
jgi:hypothetical protein